jgi:hypothetical protein
MEEEGMDRGGSTGMLTAMLEKSPMITLRPVREE